MKQKGSILLQVIILVLAVGTIALFAYYQTSRTNRALEEMKSKLNSDRIVITSPTPSVSNSQQPTLVMTQKLTPSRVPSPTTAAAPTPRPFAEEEKMMRKTLAGFEMYISSGNMAGALTFFTQPQTSSAKANFNEIRGKNLPFTLNSWSFVEDNNYLLVSEAINGGYKVRMTECRSNSGSCDTLIVEIVRNERAENGFMIERYYGTQYMYQNNLGEEIKYQGFTL